MRAWLLLLWCVLSVTAQDPVYNVGLLDVGNSLNRQQIVQAFLLAIDDTNYDSFETNAGTRFRLNGVPVLIPNNGNTTRALLDEGRQLAEDQSLVALIGSWDEDFTIDSQVLSKGAMKPYIGYKAESSLLADRERFPYFMRVNPSEVQQSLAMAQFIYAMQWQRVGVVAGTSSKSADIFMKVARARGISVVHRATITNYNDQAASAAALVEVQQKGATIIVLALDPSELQTVLGAAANLGFLTSFYQFLALSDYSTWGMEQLLAPMRLRYQSLIGLRWRTDSQFNSFSSTLNNRIEQLRLPCTTNAQCASRVCGPQGFCSGFGREGANMYAGFVADAVALLSACVKRLVDSSRDPLNGTILIEACRDSPEVVLGYTMTQFQLDQSGSRLMNISVVNVQADATVSVATWTPTTGVSEEEWTSDQCNAWEELPSNLGSITLLCDVPGATCNIQWPNPALGRPTGASTYLSLGVLVPSEPDALFDDWLSAMSQAMQEINNSTLALARGGLTPELRLLSMPYSNFGDLLRAAGELVKEPLLVAVFGPAYRIDEPLITVNSVSQITTAAAVPQIDYSSSGSFFLPSTNREEYPFYISLAPSDFLAARATAAILTRYRWWNVILITSTQDTNRRAVFDSVIAGSNVTVMTAVQVARGESRNSLTEKIRTLKATGARTVVCWLDSPDLFRSVFDAAFRGGLTNSQNVTWIVPSFDVTESIWMNKELRSPYSPRLLVEMQSLLCLYLPIPQEGTAASPAPNVRVSSAFDSANSMSARVKFARDAVYLVAFGVSTSLQEFRDPLEGANLVAAMRNHSYTYEVTFTGRAQRGEQDYSGVRYRTTITINGQGDRSLALVIKNMDSEGQLIDVGAFDVNANPSLAFFGDVVFVGGRAEPLRNVLCDYGWFFDAQTRSCRPCPQPAYAFDEKLWLCGELRPEELSIRATTIAISFWLVGLLVFAFLLSCAFWRYSVHTTEKTQTDWRTKASNGLRRGLRLDILMTSCAIFTESFDLITNWILGINFIDVRVQEFLWITLFYFLFLAVNTILSVVYVYHLCIALHEVVIDLGKGVNTLDDQKLASLTESRISGDRRTSVWGNNPMTARLRTRHFMTTAKIMLVLAFSEDAVTVILGGIYLIYVEFQTPWICIISIGWSLMAFGQKIGAWKDLMYLTEKKAWLLTTENTQPANKSRRGGGFVKRLSQFGKGVAGPTLHDSRPELKILAEIKRDQELKRGGGQGGAHSPLLSGRSQTTMEMQDLGGSKLARRQESFSGSGNPVTRNRRGVESNPVPPNFNSPMHGSPYGHLDDNVDDDQNVDFGDEVVQDYGMHVRDESRYDDQEHFGDAHSQPENLDDDEELIPEVEDMHPEYADENQGVVYNTHNESPPRPATAYDNQVYDGYDNEPDVVFHSGDELRRR